MNKNIIKNYSDIAQTEYNILTNDSKFILSSFIKEFYTFNIISLTYYKKNHNKIDNLIIYYDINTKKEYENFINTFTKYRPKYYTYIYLNSNENNINININDIKIDIKKIIIINYYLPELKFKIFNEKNNILKITNFHERDFIFFKRMPENCSNFRLIQYYDSGTCYYNSILNGLMFTGVLNNDIINNIKENNKLNIIQEFFYNILINKKKLVRTEDKIKELHNELQKIYFIKNKYGGYDSDALYFTLLKLGFKKESIYINNIINIKKFTDRIFNNISAKFNDKYNRFVIENDTDIYEFKIINNNRYVLAFSCLSYIFAEDMKNKTNNNLELHSVLAYKCAYDNKYYIYDSLGDYIFELDYIKNKDLLDTIYYNFYHILKFNGVYCNFYIKE
jgi:hypothetical protein